MGLELSPAEDGAEGKRESWGGERREASWVVLVPFASCRGL